MSRIKTESLNDSLLKKKENYNIRATTFLKGSIKNSFLDDCIKREFNESKMAAHVFEVYYSVVNEVPHLKDKEMVDVKNYIKSKIRL